MLLIKSGLFFFFSLRHKVVVNIYVVVISDVLNLDLGSGRTELVIIRWVIVLIVPLGLGQLAVVTKHVIFAPQRDSQEHLAVFFVMETQFRGTGLVEIHE